MVRSCPLFRGGVRVDAPVITINGKTYKAVKPKAKFWREIIAFDESISQLATVEFIDKTAEIIAGAFEGVTAEMVLDGMYLDDVRKVYTDLYRWVLWLLNSKLEEMPKNAEAAKAAT